MKTVVIKGQKRETIGKKESKKLRLQEIVPAVLYGGEATVHFAVPFSELRQLVYTPNVYLVDIDVEGTIYKAMIQDIQWHAVKEQILHIDFLIIQDGKPIKIDVPVAVSGLAKGIKMGGKISINLRRLKVKALAQDLPDSITVDVTDLGIGDSIKVSEIEIANVELLDTKSNVVVAVSITRAAKSAGGAGEDTEEDEGEEGEEAATKE
ncbi:MAG: 50S ribosomal protein L25/general stress protein Ctc [Bacteroidetes bacterium]|nr:50S ribosomal protein L25/general stress protein Ctc [Bacteroidota bacterium]